MITKSSIEKEKKHGNADVLSRRPRTEESDAAFTSDEEGPMVRPLRDKEGDRTTEENLPDEVSSQVREIPCEEGHCQIGLKRRQEEDPVLGDIVRLRRNRHEVPSQEELSKESDVTKKLCLQWDRLEVVNEVVYRRLPGSKLEKKTTCSC